MLFAGITIGLAIVAFVYFGPGQITWLSDLFLLTTTASTIGVAGVIATEACKLFSELAGCTLGNIRASTEPPRWAA